MATALVGLIKASPFPACEAHSAGYVSSPIALLSNQWFAENDLCQYRRVQARVPMAE